MNLNNLNTEKRNVNSMHIDEMDTESILKVINEEDKKIPFIIEECIPSINNLIDHAYPQLCKDGRIIYIGAGTSGRLGVLDASECPPTYGVSYDMFQGLIAGGKKALYCAVENAEDNKELAIQDLKEIHVNANDVVIGLAASGRTPYVISALEYANSIGAVTGSISCVKNSQLSTIAKYPIEVITGAEVVTGSSRMKAGTAQKLILNMISTTLMIKYGKVYENLMIDVQPTNEKLVNRAISIIKTIVNCDNEKAEELFNNADKSVKLAVMIGLTNANKKACQIALEENRQNTKKAIQSLLNQ